MPDGPRFAGKEKLNDVRLLQDLVENKREKRKKPSIRGLSLSLSLSLDTTLSLSLSLSPLSLPSLPS